MFKKSLVAVMCLCTFSCYASESDIKKIFGDWKLTILTDKLTDEVSYFATTDEQNNDHQLTYNNKYYAFACKEGKLTEAIYVKNLITLGNSKAKLDIRIDKEKSFQRNAIIVDGSFFNQNITAEEIEQLRGKNSIFIRANAPTQIIDMEFSLKGFDEAIQPVLDACNIK
ncbi:hypothetical protein A9G22_00660 [Gilliamella sp. App2-1]|uniref:hypothetical protein n=1 Tax=Gilliamella sp. App2-1 TaxID=3120230 RepID=UPI0008282C58|nr:hypothetical protein [Gilliamella apicola]OCG25368.1 hypothetical protein A9G22_00660 [Gilliamella apicola]